jgi:hypothetical protein
VNYFITPISIGLGLVLLIGSWNNSKVHSLNTLIGSRNSGTYKFEAKVFSRTDSNAVLTNTKTNELVSVLVPPYLKLTGTTGTATINLRGNSRSLIKWGTLEQEGGLLGKVTHVEAGYAKIGDMQYRINSLEAIDLGPALVGRTAYGQGNSLERIDP